MFDDQVVKLAIHSTIMEK